jgi:hypothetical protein
MAASDIDSSFSHGDNIINDYSRKDIIALLNRHNPPEEPLFKNKTLEDQQEILLIEQENYSLQEKYKIIIYFTIYNIKPLLLYIKEELLWDFDFYFNNFSYPIITIVYSKSLEDIKFYFEVLKVDYDYNIYEIQYSNIILNDKESNNNILYATAINTLRYDFAMFEYVFNKVIEKNHPDVIKGNKNLLFSIISCNNVEFICNVIDTYNLDIQYINPKIRLNALHTAFERCSLDTILYLNDKYKCNIFESIKRDIHLQEIIINYLFTYFNGKSIQATFYIFPETERERIFQYIIQFIDDRNIIYSEGILFVNKKFINYDVYMNIIKKHKFKSTLECISTICTTCNKEIKKEDGTTFYMSSKDNVYHSECCEELEKEEFTKVYINSCPICLDDKEKEYVISYCGHMNCINCITEYIKHSDTCSYCRNLLTFAGYIEF